MWSHSYPCFGLLVMYALGFKARVDFSLACFLAYVLVLRFTSGVTPADVSMVSSHIPYLHVAEVKIACSRGKMPGFDPEISLYMLPTRPSQPASV